jgi:hypothetical protein
MNKHKNVKSANFCCEGTPSIDIVLAKGPTHISLFTGFIERQAKKLSEIELEQVISILSRDKEAMQKQHDFPLVFEELLSDLIKAQIVRYGVKRNKKRKLGYSVSPGKLEEILGEYYNLEKVFIHSIYVGSNMQDAKTILLESSKEKDDRVLFVNFQGKEREDE